MKSSFSIFVLSILSIFNIQAQKTYPLATADKMIICTGTERVENMTDKDIFMNALLWAIDKGNRFKETITQCDMENLKYATVLDINSKKNPKQSYKCDLTIQINSGNIIFLTNKIFSNTTGIMGSITPFEKLNPTKKIKHKELIEEFTLLNSSLLSELFQFIRTNKLQPINHLESVSRGIVEKGMNETECKLAIGKPVDIRLNSQRTQWMYDSSTYIFFEKGLVTAIIK